MISCYRTFVTVIAFTLLVGNASAQKKIYTVADAHSHNDYEQANPFYAAYDAGFGSIEADVFAINGKLLVAHKLEEVNAERSLAKLYIRPLIKKLAADTGRHLRLLIDIKNEYTAVLPLVIKELNPLSKYFSYPGHPGQLAIVMTGAVPPAALMNNYPNWMLFDVKSVLGFTPVQVNKIGLVSMPFTKYTRWNGNDPLPANTVGRIRAGIDSVHNAGKMVRFYETPDTKQSWNLLIGVGVDVIGTDDIPGLSGFLRNRKPGE